MTGRGTSAWITACSPPSTSTRKPAASNVSPGTAVCTCPASSPASASGPVRSRGAHTCASVPATALASCSGTTWSGWPCVTRTASAPSRTAASLNAPGSNARRRPAFSRRTAEWPKRVRVVLMRITPPPGVGIPGGPSLPRAPGGGQGPRPVRRRPTGSRPDLRPDARRPAPPRSCRGCAGRSPSAARSERGGAGQRCCPGWTPSTFALAAATGSGAAVSTRTPWPAAAEPASATTFCCWA